MKVAEANDVVAFQDLDDDRKLGAGEPLARLDGLGGLQVVGRTAATLPPLSLDPATPRPELSLDFTDQANEAQSTVGQVVPLSDARFDDDRVSEGMWAPLTAAAKGGYGLHFLAPHAPGKVPVVFVHGIAGSPRNFEPVLAALDHTRFEPWLVYYPSGIRLPLLSKLLAEMMVRAASDLGVKKMVVVAHSMGGLVARGALEELVTRGQGDLVDRFITLATPWGGHATAAVGVEMAPQAVPSWLDLVPGSPFLQSLERPLPMPFHLLFAVGGRGDRLPTNNDGVVAVASQLAPWAQAEAVRTWGFDCGHVGILGNEAALAKLNELLSR